MNTRPRTSREPHDGLAQAITQRSQWSAVKHSSSLGADQQQSNAPRSAEDDDGSQDVHVDVWKPSTGRMDGRPLPSVGSFIRWKFPDPGLVRTGWQGGFIFKSIWVSFHDGRMDWIYSCRCTTQRDLTWDCRRGNSEKVGWAMYQQQVEVRTSSSCTQPRYVLHTTYTTGGRDPRGYLARSGAPIAIDARTWRVPAAAARMRLKKKIIWSIFHVIRISPPSVEHSFTTKLLQAHCMDFAHLSQTRNSTR